MTGKVCFVQFPHPGREHGPTSGRHWNKLKHDHRRKFMRFRGDWVDDDGDTHTGNLRAWGEWEPESELICEFNTKDGGPHHPSYLWKPFYVPKDSYACLHNTDPFIFGDCFLYSNCGQSAESKRGLKHLAPGSVISFGSGMKIDGKRKWVLDTVLVVRDSVEYDMHEARTALKDWASDTFLEVVGGPLCDHPDNTTESAGACVPTCTQTSTRLRLYRGATPDNLVNEMFSFFPAMPEGNGTGFSRPAVNLPDEYFNTSNWQAPKGHGRERKPEELRSLWDSLVAQVRGKGLVLGTRAALPKLRAR